MLQKVGYSVVGTATIAIALAIIALMFKSSRGPFFLAGTGAALAAHLIALAAFATFSWLTKVTPAGWFVAVGNPPIEEATRIVALATIAQMRGHRWGLAFGLGFGALEGVTKLVELGLYVSQADASLLRVAAAVSAPVVPFLLHVFLSVLAISLRRARAPWLQIFAATTVLHLAHNLSVVFVQFDDYLSLVIANLIRAAIFVLIVVILIRQNTITGDLRAGQ
jgi:hypothetical protein